MGGKALHKTTEQERAFAYLQHRALLSDLFSLKGVK